jgi:hypothetical protein
VLRCHPLASGELRTADAHSGRLDTVMHAISTILCSVSNYPGCVTPHARISVCFASGHSNGHSRKPYFLGLSVERQSSTARSLVRSRFVLRYSWVDGVGAKARINLSRPSKVWLTHGW